MKTLILLTISIAFSALFGYASTVEMKYHTLGRLFIFEQKINRQNSDYPEKWTSGQLNAFYLDFAHTQKNWNKVNLKAGKYKWTVQTVKRNNKQGKVNFKIVVKSKNAPTLFMIDKKFSPGKTDSGEIIVEDFQARGNDALAGFGRVDILIERAGSNTNVNFKITLTRIGDVSSHKKI